MRGRPDLHVRQAERNLLRVLVSPGRLRRKLVHLRPYLEHEDERIRALAREMMDFWHPPYDPADDEPPWPEEPPWDPDVPPWDPDHPPGWDPEVPPWEGEA